MRKPKERPAGGPRVVAVLGQKGGSGKTTLAMHLAGTWGRAGKRVLVVDADPQGTATRWSASAPEDAEPFPATVVSLAAAGARLHTNVAKLAPAYDLVVIDTPPAVDQPQPRAALGIADLALVPVVPSPPDLWAAVGVRDLIRAMEGPELQARLVLSMVQAGTTLARETEDALTDFGIPLLEASLGLRQAYRQAAVYGTTVHGMKDAKAADEVEALAREVLGLLGTR